ncbi:MAG: hypothetical protein AB7S38_10490 [Vulcanimicrobiota bacterium]
MQVRHLATSHAATHQQPAKQAEGEPRDPQDRVELGTHRDEDFWAQQLRELKERYPNGMTAHDQRVFLTQMFD